MLVLLALATGSAFARERIRIDSITVTDQGAGTLLVEADGHGFIRGDKSFNVTIGGVPQTEACRVQSNALFDCEILAADYPAAEYVMSAWHGKPEKLNEKTLSITSFTIDEPYVGPPAVAAGAQGAAGAVGAEGENVLAA